VTAGAPLGGRSFGFWLAAIAAGGAAIRIAYTLLAAPWPPGLFNDEAYYATLAKLLESGEGFVRPAEFFRDGLSLPTAERAPLFPLALAGLAGLGLDGGDGRLLGVLTGAGTIVALGLLGRRLGGLRAGLMAASLGALYPTLIAADGALMTESLYGLFAGFALLAAYRLVDAPGTGRALALGALLGLAALVRGEGLVLLLVLLAAMIGRAGGWRTVVPVVVAFALVLTPWTVRNWSAFDRPVLIATEGGETLAGANCEPTYYGPEIGTWDVDCVKVSGRRNEAVETNELGRDAIEYALDHPARLPFVAAARLARTWGVYKPFKVPEGRRAWVMYVGVALYFVLVPLAVYGFILLHRRGPDVWIIAAPVLTVTLATLASYGSIRFRHSAELSIVVLGAVALDRLWRRRAATTAARTNPAI
jgi:4-amino-4-deoxy-L-arabinose transferase-like glycosyltransferase